MGGPERVGNGDFEHNLEKVTYYGRNRIPREQSSVFVYIMLLDINFGYRTFKFRHYEMYHNSANPTES